MTKLLHPVIVFYVLSWLVIAIIAYFGEYFAAGLLAIVLAMGTMADIKAFWKGL